MKKYYTFLLLILSTSFGFNACGEDGICSCGTSCSIATSGELSCSLDTQALAERKEKIQKLFISKAEKIEETDTGYQFLFKDTDKLNEKLFDFIIKEKKCCPFFQYDLTILPYNEGITLTISGDAQVKDFLKEIVEI